MIRYFLLGALILLSCKKDLAQGKSVNHMKGPAINLGAYYFDGWTEGSHHITPLLKNGFPEREPIWGWVTSTPDIMKKQIDAAADAGIQFFSFDWYYREGLSNIPLNNALSLYLDAPNKQRLKFCLMVANHKPYLTTPQSWKTLTGQWIKLFKDPTYLKVNEKPLLIFFSVSSLVTEFGDAAAVHKALDSLRHVAVAEGLKGGTMAVCVGPSEVRDAEACGFDILTGYNYHVVGFTPGQAENPIQQMLAGDRSIWEKISGTTSLPYIPVATLNWDPRPWRKTDEVVQRFTGYSQQSVYNDITALQEWIAQHPGQTPKERIALLYAWNENGEGGWLTPSKILGDSLLQGIRKAIIKK
ncbi:glycoside hydrolase family 99-like domain-containing protein [Chitinophaga sp. MM2321]|uniref:glycoside hydrolase family 99-like domain-containing protein n=1 Tax=Chitinophaga sp. MM2321 TaxID=3137178 RepID=UPI0032D58443